MGDVEGRRTDGRTDRVGVQGQAEHVRSRHCSRGWGAQAGRGRRAGGAFRLEKEERPTGSWVWMLKMRGAGGRGAVGGAWSAFF